MIDFSDVVRRFFDEIKKTCSSINGAIDTSTSAGKMLFQRSCPSIPRQLGWPVSDWSSNGSRSSWLLDTADKRQKQLPSRGYISFNADEIHGGTGNDLVFGDFAAIIPIVASKGKAGMITSTRVLPIGETSASQTATLRYTYQFGAQGPLHSAGTKDVNRKIPFSIDTDEFAIVVLVAL